MPKAPSLQLPAVVTDLQATRRGDNTELQFALPTETTEGLPYRYGPVRASVCRAVEAGGCVPVAALTGVLVSAVGSVPAAGGAVGAPGNTAGSTAGDVAGSATGPAGQRATLHDALPPDLRVGAARLLTYRVELSNARGRTAGFGDAAYSAAGAGPAGVEGLRAEGGRQGVAVRWEPGGSGDGSEVVLRRELVSGGSAGMPVKTPRPGGTGGPQAGNGSGTGLVGGAEGETGARTGAGTGTAAGDGPGGTLSKAGKRRGSRRRTGLGIAGVAKSRGERETPGVVWLSTAPEGDPLESGPPASVPPDDKSGTARAGGQASAASKQANGVLDDSALMSSTYRYAAERQRTVLLGGHTTTLESGLSAPVEVTLRAVYPPPAPIDLTGTAFPLAPAGTGEASGGVAVDLIWTPADDAKTVGFAVYREAVGTDGAARGERVKLTAAPVRMPAFHEVLPQAIARASGLRLRYSVTAVDASGMESTPVTTVVEVGGR